MLSYVVRRVFLVIPTLIGITLVTFFIVQLAPGDPISAAFGAEQMDARISADDFDELLSFYGLDKPLYEQYWIWLKNLARLNFGNSFTDHRPVTAKILERLPATLILNGISLFLTFLVAIPLGILSAVKQKSAFDKINGTLLYMLYSLPNFWIALLLVSLFGVTLQWLPIGGMESQEAQSLAFWPRMGDRLVHLVLPVVCLSYASVAYFSRFARGTLLEVIQQDYIRTARAKGLSESRVILKHALRNVLIPLITLLGNVLPFLLSGSVIIEYIFSWPGIGRLFFESVLTRDYNTVMGLSFLTAVVTLFATLLADLLYAVVDPRVSYR